MTERSPSKFGLFLVVVAGCLAFLVDSVAMYKLGCTSCDPNSREKGSSAWQVTLACEGDKPRCGKQVIWRSNDGLPLHYRIRYVTDASACAPIVLHVYKNGKQEASSGPIGNGKAAVEMEFDLRARTSHDRVWSLGIEPEVLKEGCAAHGVLEEWVGTFQIWY